MHRLDSPNHAEYVQWLEAQINSDAAYGLSDLVLSGFLRIVTHPRVFEKPSTWSEASAFAEQLRNQPNRVVVSPGPHHWEIFVRLCKSAGAKGNLVPDDSSLRWPSRMAANGSPRIGISAAFPN